MRRVIVSRVFVIAFLMYIVILKYGTTFSFTLNEVNLSIQVSGETQGIFHFEI